MSHLYDRLATVLEKTADFLDTQDAEKTATAQDDRNKQVSAFSEKYATALGEDLSEDVITKLAASDEDLLSAFQKLAAHVGDDNGPDDMGAPGDMPDGDPVYMTKKAALAAKANAADESFVNFIMSE